jgi:hypothetical protein
VTAVTVPDNRFTLEGHELVIVESARSAATAPPSCTSDLDLVVAAT